MKALPVFTLKPRNVTPFQNKTWKMDEPVRHSPNGPIRPVEPVSSGRMAAAPFSCRQTSILIGLVLG